MKKAIFNGLLCAFSVSVLCLGSAWGQTAEDLLIGTSDAFQGKLDVQIVLDDDSNATAFQYVSPTKTESFDVSAISQGIVLMNTQGYDVIILKSPDFDPQHGGTLDITYLHSALSSEYRDLVLDLVRTGDQWQLMANDQSGHHDVTQGYFKANRFLGQVIGIDTITLK